MPLVQITCKKLRIFELESSLLSGYAGSMRREAHMKVVALAFLVLAASTLAQTVKEPGHLSRHASVAKKYGGGGTVPVNASNGALANELAKIEAQGAHAPTSAASRPAPSTAAVPKAKPSARTTNRPMKYSPPRQRGNPNDRPH
jgi:hypothetical protein